MWSLNSFKSVEDANIDANNIFNGESFPILISQDVGECSRFSIVLLDAVCTSSCQATQSQREIQVCQHSEVAYALRHATE